jgi:hypothetical protein
MMELCIAWPTKLNDMVVVNLHVKGISVRTQGSYTAVQISGSEFRIPEFLRATEP